MDEQKRKITFQQAVDFIYNALGLLRSGGSANVTVGPYASSVSVQPVVQASAFPWKTVLIVGGVAVAALLILGD